MTTLARSLGAASCALALAAASCTSGLPTSLGSSGGSPSVKLAFSLQPSSVAAGATISPPVVVAVQDGFGNTVPTATLSVTVAIGNNGGGGTLSGTTTVAAVRGFATFADLAIDKAGTGYTLTAAATGVIGATSNPFAVTTAAAARIRRF
jgi:hypothetical protein